MSEKNCFALFIHMSSPQHPGFLQYITTKIISQLTPIIIPEQWGVVIHERKRTKQNWSLLSMQPQAWSLWTAEAPSCNVGSPGCHFCPANMPKLDVCSGFPESKITLRYEITSEYMWSVSVELQKSVSLSESKEKNSWRYTNSCNSTLKDASKILPPFVCTAEAIPGTWNRL